MSRLPDPAQFLQCSGALRGRSAGDLERVHEPPFAENAWNIWWATWCASANPSLGIEVHYRTSRIRKPRVVASSVGPFAIAVDADLAECQGLEPCRREVEDALKVAAQRMGEALPPFP